MKNNKLTKSLKAAGFALAVTAAVGATNMEAQAAETNDTVIETVDTNSASESYSYTETFDTKEEAEQRQQEITSDLESKGYTNIDSSITEVKNEKEVGTEEVMTSETTSTKTETYDTKEEAEEAAKNAEKDTKEETVTAEVSERTVDTGKDETYSNTTNGYATEEEAKAAAEAEANKIKDAGYDVSTNVDSYEEKTTHQEEKYTGDSSESYTETFDNVDDAQDYADEVKKDTKEETVTAEVTEREQDAGYKDEYTTGRTFTSENGANNYADSTVESLKDEGYTDDQISSSVTSREVEVKVGTEEVLVSEKTTTEEDAYTFESEEEAEAKKAELEKDTKEETITVTISTESIDTGLDETHTVVKTFESAKEAEEYLQTLRDQGYEVSNVKINTNYKTEKVSMDETYDTMSEAIAALQSFQSTNSNVNDGKITSVRDTTEDETVVTDGTIRYTDKEEAEEAAKAINSDSEYTSTTGVVREDTETYDIGDLANKTFDSKEEAEAYIQSLKDAGFDVSDYSIDKHTNTYVVAIDIKSGSESCKPVNKDNRANLFIRIDGEVQYEDGQTGYSNDSYVYAGSVGVNKTEVWDEDANNHGDDLAYLVANNNEIAENITSAISMETIKQILGQYGISLSDDQVIVWYVLKDQSDNAVSRRAYTDASGKTVYVDLPSCSYHIDGVIRSKEEVQNFYSVDGNAAYVVYYVDTETTTKGYDYQVTASGTNTVDAGTVTAIAKTSKDIMEDVYVLDVTTTDRTYEEKDVYGKQTVYDVSVIAEKEHYDTVYDVNVVETTHNYEMVDVEETETKYSATVEGTKDITQTVYDVTTTTTDRTYETRDVYGTVTTYDTTVEGTKDITQTVYDVTTTTTDRTYDTMTVIAEDTDYVLDVDAEKEEVIVIPTPTPDPVPPVDPGTPEPAPQPPVDPGTPEPAPQPPVVEPTPSTEETKEENPEEVIPKMGDEETNPLGAYMALFGLSAVGAYGYKKKEENVKVRTLKKRK